MSRKYSPAWKPLRKGSRELTWKEEEVGGERECRAAIPEKPRGDGLEKPLVSFLVGRDPCSGHGFVGNQQRFLMKKQRSPSKTQRMVPVNPWGGCSTPQLARTLGESLVALQMSEGLVEMPAPVEREKLITDRKCLYCRK